MSAERTIDNLYRAAKGSREDAESLRELASELEKWGATDKAAQVRKWAQEAERKWAQEAVR